MKKYFIILFAFLFSFNSEAQFLINPYSYTTPTDTLLLDTSSADVAYSLRKLRTAYSGNCISIRRSSDNATTNIGFVGNIVDTAAIMSFTGTASAFVRTWYNQGTLSFDVTQTTDANQPRIVNAGTLETKNGKPAIYFDGSNDYLQNASHPTCIEDGNEHSCFCVGSNDISGGNRRIVSSFGSDLKSEWYVLVDRSALKRNFTIANNIGTAFRANMPSQIDNSDYRLLSGFATTGKVMSGYVNGSGGVGDTYSGTINLGSFTVGARNDGATPLQGHVGEIIIMPVDQTSNRTAIEGNINTFYTIY